jgi:hypothetical protein
MVRENLWDSSARAVRPYRTSEFPAWSTTPYYLLPTTCSLCPSVLLSKQSSVSFRAFRVPINFRARLRRLRATKTCPSVLLSKKICVIPCANKFLRAKTCSPCSSVYKRPKSPPHKLPGTNISYRINCVPLQA